LLEEILEKFSPGENIKIKVLRKSAEVELNLKIGELK